MQLCFFGNRPHLLSHTQAVLIHNQKWSPPVQVPRRWISSTSVTTGTPGRLWGPRALKEAVAPAALQCHRAQQVPGARGRVSPGTAFTPALPRTQLLRVPQCQGCGSRARHLALADQRWGRTPLALPGVCSSEPSPSGGPGAQRSKVHNELGSAELQPLGGERGAPQCMLA